MERERLETIALEENRRKTQEVKGKELDLTAQRTENERDKAQVEASAIKRDAEHADEDPVTPQEKISHYVDWLRTRVCTGARAKQMLHQFAAQEGLEMALGPETEPRTLAGQLQHSLDL